MIQPSELPMSQTVHITMVTGFRSKKTVLMRLYNIIPTMSYLTGFAELPSTDFQEKRTLPYLRIRRNMLRALETK